MYSIIHNFTIHSNAKKVFEAMSTPEGLNNWWTLKCSGKPALNEEYNLNFTDEYDWFAKISKFEENKLIEFSMEKAMEDWLPTKFGFELNEDGNQTHVHFYHTNWQEQNQHYGITSYCWANLLRQMKDYIEKGIITEFSKRN